MLPEPTLNTVFSYSLFAAAIKASATSVTYVKSLVCEPSPTIVKGSSFNFWARKTPNTAPYVPEVRERGPYTLKSLNDMTGIL